MIQSLDRAMTILSILEQKNTASVTEIAEELGVNKSTVSRLMETLKKHDMVQADPATKKYGPIRDPKTIPPAVAIRICVVRDNPFFFPSIVSPFSFPFFFFLVLIPVLTFRFTFPCPVCLYFKAQSCLKQ